MRRQGLRLNLWLAILLGLALAAFVKQIDIPGSNEEAPPPTPLKEAPTIIVLPVPEAEMESVVTNVIECWSALQNVTQQLEGGIVVVENGRCDQITHIEDSELSGR